MFVYANQAKLNSLALATLIYNFASKQKWKKGGRTEGEHTTTVRTIFEHSGILLHAQRSSPYHSCTNGKKRERKKEKKEKHEWMNIPPVHCIQEYYFRSCLMPHASNCTFTGALYPFRLFSTVTKLSAQYKIHIFVSKIEPFVKNRFAWRYPLSMVDGLRSTIFHLSYIRRRFTSISHTSIGIHECKYDMVGKYMAMDMAWPSRLYQL